MNNNKKGLWWLIGLIFPVIGIVLYFVWKKNYKQRAKSVLVGSIISIVLCSLGLLYYSTHPRDYFNRDVSEWFNDISKGNTVVTVIGASYCSHCQEYKPVVKLMANKYDMNLYFYELDEMEEEDADVIKNSFELTGYSGSVPYTAIFKNGAVVDYHEGYESEAVLKDFFKTNGVIKV